MGKGRAGGAPARQDVVFHIKGVGALGRASNVHVPAHYRLQDTRISIVVVGTLKSVYMAIMYTLLPYSTCMVQGMGLVFDMQ